MRGILRARRHSSSSVVAVCRLVMNKVFCMAKARVRRCRRCGRAIICASTDIFIFGSALRAMAKARVRRCRRCGRTDTCIPCDGVALAADASYSSGYDRQRR